jgi:ATP-dependent RNA helicase DHX29
MHGQSAVSRISNIQYSTVQYSTVQCYSSTRKRSRSTIHHIAPTMAKKKGKNGKQDARGYSTSVSTTKTNAPATTAKTHGNLQSLLNQATDESSSSAQKTEASALLLSQLDTTSKRFYRKIENLHDQLIRCRFSEEQIDIVVRELGNSPTNSPTDSDTTATTSDLYTVESALDWLCLNLPAEELPALFTEHNVREALSQTTTSVEVIQPTPQQFQSGSNEIRFDESSNQHLLFESSDNSKETEDHDADDEAKKAWILNQYQYEEEEDDDAVNADEKADDTPFQPRVEVMLSPLELRLQTLETEIKELHSEVNDEASNYMRSKYEIKEMKKELSKLQGQAKKLRGQVAKSKVVAEQVPQVAKLVVVEEKKELEGGEDAMDEDMGGCFGMFNEPNEDHVPQKPPETKEPPAVEVEEYDPLRLRSSTPSIPKEWTGTTPKDQLEVWCKKRKVARPTFTKLPHTSNGCRMKIKTKPDVCLEEKGPFYDFVDAQQFLATRALYQMSSELPMYRMFPPVFRDLWKSWLGRVEEAKSIQKQENRQAKDERIRELIELIPKQLRIGDVAEDAKDELVVDMTTQPLELDDWEGAETTEIEPSQSQSRLGRELMAEFSRRRGTSAFKAMEEIRQSLPMYTFRSELLQCVANNAVTVLCAETGAGKTTQGPQFMLEEALKSGKGDKTSIICTQPRRISAMSVAERVADEMCVKLGDLIGYQIRGEVKKSQRTKLLFCTTGVVLRRLQDDPSLSGVTTVVVDEVHERSWQIDFLLIALRRLLQTSRPDLKVVLVSTRIIYYTKTPFDLTCCL